MTDESGEATTKTVRLLWVDTEEKQIVFANHLLIQHEEGEFVISFGQATAPPILGDPQHREQALEALEFVPIKTIARIGLSPQRMAAFVSVMQQNLEKYESVYGSKSE